MVELKLSPRRIALGLFGVFLLLLICYAVVVVFRLQAGDHQLLIDPLFDFDREGNFPSWFNSVLFVLAAAASFINGRFAHRHDPRQAARWLALAAVMMFLSVDELVAFHELLGQFKALRGTFYFSWMMVFGPLAAALGLWFIPFLLRLPRTIALPLAFSGVVFLTGAIGFEILGGKIVESITHVPSSEVTPEQWAIVARTPLYLLEVALEESFEQCGLIIYIYAALRYLSVANATMSVRLPSARA